MILNVHNLRFDAELIPIADFHTEMLITICFAFAFADICGGKLAYSVVRPLLKWQLGKYLKNIVFSSVFSSGIAFIIFLFSVTEICGTILEFQVSNGNHTGTLGLATKSTVLELGLPMEAFAVPWEQGEQVQPFTGDKSEVPVKSIISLQGPINSFGGVLPAIRSACLGWEEQAKG